MTDQTITRKEIERVSAALAAVDATARHDAVDVKLIGTFMAMNRDIVEKLRNAADAALSHPAALERARAEERERCALVPTYRAQDLRAIIDTPSPAYAARLPEFAQRADEAEGIAAAIRDLGSAQWIPTHRHYKGGLYRELMRVEREGDCEALVIYEAQDGRRWARPAVEFDGTIEFFDPCFGASRTSRFRTLGPAPSPEAAAAPSAANFEMPTTYRSVPTVTTGGTLPPATPPAMPADLRERVVRAIRAFVPELTEYQSTLPDGYRPYIGMFGTTGEIRAARALLAELEGSKPDPEPPVDWQPIETVPTDRSKIDVRGGPHGMSTLWANPEATSHLKKTFTEWRPYRKPVEESQP